MKINKRLGFLVSLLLVLAHVSVSGEASWYTEEEISSQCGMRFKAIDFDIQSDELKNIFGTLSQWVGGLIAPWHDELINIAEEPLKKFIKSRSPAIVKNPYQNEVASVRFGNELSQGEKTYLNKRKKIVKQALEKLLGRELLDDDYIPRIALVCSGGGYRAMVSTLGSFVGADTIGLLDTVMWLVGLSGSTWIEAIWMSTGLSIRELKKRLCNKVEHHLTTLTPQEAKQLVRSLLVKWAFDQPMTVVDLYGGLLANRLLDDFGEECHLVYLSEQQKLLEEALVPFPIYTAVSPINEGKDLVWFEFNPYEIGSAWLRCFIPSWGYGRRYSKGLSQDYAPEQPLAYHMGTCGSAFSATIEQMYSEIEQKVHFDDALDTIATKILNLIGNYRITWAEVFNFVYGVEMNPLEHERYVRFIDAGLAFNLPYPPISGEREGRKADIIIFLDASSTIPGRDYAGQAEFGKVQAYAHNHGLAYPYIDYSFAGERACSVYKQKGKPVVIYMPRIKDYELIRKHKDDKDLQECLSHIADFDPEESVHSGYCNTYNFVWTEEQLEQLSSLTEFNMRASVDQIKDAIEWVIQQKRP
ncbi:MAG: hypothetical protein WBQ73_03355 [Candidatus Babeliales bacterium]